MSGGSWVVPGAAVVAAGAAAAFAHRRAAHVADGVVAEQVRAEEARREAEEGLRWMNDWILPDIRRVRVELAEHLPGGAAPGPEPDGGPYADAHRSLEYLCYELRAVVERPNSEGQQVEMLLHVARRLQTLVMRALKQITDLEFEIEDPDLQAHVFDLDHVLTRLRRAVESLAVIGGQSPRTSPDPVPLATVLRQAASEIEDYERVSTGRVPEVSVPGYAAVLVIHLLAELIENATKWSPPQHRVEVHTVVAPAGPVSVSIDDIGLLMDHKQRSEMNRLLRQPAQYPIDNQIRRGQLGLYVTALVAQRYGIQVQLRQNIQGGNQAIVVLPQRLLEYPAPPPTVSAPAPSRPSQLAPSAPRPVAQPVRHAPAEPAAAATMPLAKVDGPQDGVRPPLPRRSAAVRHQVPHIPGPAAEDAVPVDTTSMARFAAGRARAGHHQAPEAHRTSVPNHP